MTRRALLKEGALELGLTEHYLRTEIKAGRIPYLKAGNRYIIDVEQVEEFLKNKSIENMNSSNVVNNQYGVLRKCGI